MSDLEGTFKKPYEKFKGVQADAWIPLAYQIGLRGVPLRVLAHKFNCHIGTIEDYPQVLQAFQEGQADHRITVEDLLWTDANMSPDFASDPVEKAAIRQAKQAALKLLKTSIDKKAEFVAPQETERLRRLSDEELQEELKKHVR